MSDATIRLEFRELPRLQADVMTKWTRAKYRKSWHEKIWLAVLETGRLPAEPWERAVIICTRYSSVEPDRCNNANGFKPLVDGLIRAQVIAGDKPHNLPIESYRWEKAPPKGGRVEIKVSEYRDQGGREPKCAQCGSMLSNPWMP